MCFSPAFDMTDPTCVRRVFDYQETKRLHLLIDQLLWSFDLSTPDQFHLFQPHLRQMIVETQNHLQHLAAPLRH